jgi:hypothetical protein
MSYESEILPSNENKDISLLSDGMFFNKAGIMNGHERGESGDNFLNRASAISEDSDNIFKKKQMGIVNK